MSDRLPDPRSRPGAGRKLSVVAAIIALTTGLSGYFMGLLQTDRSARVSEETRLQIHQAPPPHADNPSASAPAAPVYAALTDRTRQPNHAWHSQLSSLPPPPKTTNGAPSLSDEASELLLSRRRDRRAFDGAPPTVPHPIDQHQSVSCLACHGTPTRIGAIDVPQVSHPSYTHCIQCHAPAGGPGPALAAPPPSLASPILANTFAGLSATVRGDRAHTDAPPTVPHATAMHQNCIACHGPGGSSVLKPTHPQRQNCMQCHALDARRETFPLLRAATPVQSPDTKG